SQGQLTNNDLTRQDLFLIHEWFIKTLLYTHYLRLKYPELVQAAETEDSVGKITAVNGEKLAP
ncbi:MAG: hypothetical protein AAGU05_13415, partial [Anaerolineaceae bacterium]